MANVTQRYCVIRESPSGQRTVAMKSGNKSFIREYLASQSKSVFPQLTVFETSQDPDFNTKEQLPYFDPQLTMWESEPEK